MRTSALISSFGNTFPPAAESPTLPRAAPELEGAGLGAAGLGAAAGAGAGAAGVGAGVACLRAAVSAYTKRRIQELDFRNQQ